MSQCLRDENLWLVFEGVARGRNREHVEQCGKCSARLRQLQNEVQILSSVLRETPPVSIGAHPSRAFLWRWVPMATAGAIALLLVWSGLFSRTPHLGQPAALSPARQEEIVKVLEGEVYDALFMNDELPTLELSSRVSTLAYVQAALDGRWPCERRHTPHRILCDQQPFFLRGEKQ